MSRLEKAIEVAARKRNASDESSAVDTAAAEAPPLQQKPRRPSVSGKTTHIDNPFLVTANDQGSPASEQYRKLKSLIVNLAKVNQAGRTIMVTSPVAGEGKTITSLNLAIAMAQDFDHTVLLIEADIRKPSVLKYLGLEAKRGLTDCVMENLDVADVLVKTGLGGLSVLPAGASVGNPVELFSSKRMHDLFDEVKSRYNDRYVIIDTTPLLPFAEPQYIANMAESVLLVVREGVTSPEKLKKALDILKNHNVLGVVSNGVSRISHMQGYYGYYGYR